MKQRRKRDLGASFSYKLIHGYTKTWNIPVSCFNHFNCSVIAFATWTVSSGWLILATRSLAQVSLSGSCVGLFSSKCWRKPEFRPQFRTCTSGLSIHVWASTTSPQTWPLSWAPYKCLDLNQNQICNFFTQTRSSLSVSHLTIHLTI